MQTAWQWMAGSGEVDEWVEITVEMAWRSQLGIHSNGDGNENIEWKNLNNESR